MKSSCLLSLFFVFCMVGCATRTRYVAQGGKVEAVAGFTQDDIDDVVSRAVQSVLAQDRIKIKEGSNRTVMMIDDVTNDTLSRGRDANALAEAIGLSLREELTNCGKVVVYNKAHAQYAKVKIEPQYRLYGRLTQRSLRQDNGDIQVEYSLNIQLVELSTGLEFWQKRIPLRKVAASKNVM